MHPRLAAPGGALANHKKIYLLYREEKLNACKCRRRKGVMVEH